MSLQLADFEPVLRALKQIKEPPHSWVGGQAIIVWANRYLAPERIKEIGLEIPLKSKDGDLRASEGVVQFLAAALGVKPQTYRLKDPSRGTAWGLKVKLNGAPVLIDVLEKLPGVSEANPGYAIEIKAGLPDKTLTAKVLDPVSLLFNKADVWKREKDKQVEIENGTVIKPGRYDVKHMELLCQVMPRYFAELGKWEQIGASIRTTLAAERNRLLRFLDTSPELPAGVAESLRQACLPDPTVGSGERLMAAVKSSGPLPKPPLPEVPNNGKGAESSGHEPMQNDQPLPDDDQHRI